MFTKKKLYFPIIILVLAIIIFILTNKNTKYDIEKPIIKYNVKDDRVKKEYLNYLKSYVKPKELSKFIDDDFINLDGYNDSANGNSALREMEIDGYLNLFNAMFDKKRVDFSDCPTTENFKNKFQTNLFNYFNMSKADDVNIDCLLYYDEQEIEIKEYADFKNTEPTDIKTYHFHYTLDDEGNVDDVVFDYTEK